MTVVRNQRKPERREVRSIVAVFAGALTLVSCGARSEPAALEDSEPSIPLPTDARGARLALGDAHTCVLRSGAVHCWGENRRGELGDGSRAPHLVPVPVLGLPRVVDLASGGAFDIDPAAPRGAHTCAVTVTGNVLCWGANVLGGSLSLASPGEIAGTGPAALVSAGMFHTCFVRTDGHVACWGLNSEGQLGDGTTLDRASPAVVNKLRDAVQISVNRYHGCARTRSGRLFCWGGNELGQVGDGTTTDHFEPVELAELPGIIDVAAGLGTTCAVAASGAVYCWGLNNAGQLGDGTKVSRLRPAPTVGIVDAIQVSVGSTYACALRHSGQVVCWGVAPHAIARSGEALLADSSIPVVVPDLPRVVEIRVGPSGHTCAVTSTEQVYCMGRNDAGQIGDGSREARVLPTLALLGG